MHRDPSTLVRLIGLAYLAGCSPLPKDDFVKQQVDELIANYQQKNQDLAQRRLHMATDAPGIRSLHVEGTGAHATLSCHLERAPLDVVVRRVLQSAHVSYLYERNGPLGSVSAAFQEQPLLEGLNILLEPFDFEAVIQGTVVVIRERPIGWRSQPKATAQVVEQEHSPERQEGSLETDSLPRGLAGELQHTALPFHAEPDEEVTTVYRVLQPLYVTAEYLQQNVLDPVYPSNSELNHGIVQETNQIFLYGPSDEVSRAVRMLRDADQEPVHVYFETALVAFASGTREILGAALQKLAYQNLKDVNISAGFPSSPGLADAGLVSFTIDSKDHNPLSFQALLASLISINQARVFARPYLMTLSGTKASLEVGTEGFVQVPQSLSGGVTTSANPIQVGTIVSFLPVALPDGTIRLEVSVEQSQLQPASAQLSAEVQKSFASTVLHIQDGESVLIGGLNLQESETASFGFPFLEKIPVLNYFFKSTQTIYFQRQVFFYVTPRIWRPSIHTPVPPDPGLPFDHALDAINRPYQ